jgi:uncharacterized membrane protein
MLGGAGPASRSRFSAPLRGHSVVHLTGIAIMTALAATILTVFSLNLYYDFHASSYDLVIFDQAVRSYAHFRPGISIIKGVHNGFGPNFSVLGDHFSPILASLAPLYWIHNGPQTLLVAQAVLLALAIPPLWIFTRRAFGGGRKATAAAYLVSVAYGLSWPIAAVAAYDFHEVAFAPVLTAVALERFQAGRIRSALVALAFLLLVKEDMGLLVAGIGCYFVLARPRVVPRQWLVGIGCVVVGVAFTAFAVYVLIPAFGGRADYYWAYSTLGRDAPQAAWHLITHPISSLRLVITPGVKLNTMLWLVGALCFLPLLSPITVAAVPLLLERMLNSKFPNWWSTNFQYNAYLEVVLVCAAVDGAARLDRWLMTGRQYLTGSRVRPAGIEGRRPAAAGVAAGQAATTRARSASGWAALACAVAVAALAIGTVPQFKLGSLLHASFFQRTARMKAAAAAVAVVPSGVTVEAVNKLGPHLSARDTVLLWDGDGKTPVRAAPWVVADWKVRQFTFSSVRDQAMRVRLLERDGYRIVFERDGYVVLHDGPRSADHRKTKAAAR